MIINPRIVFEQYLSEKHINTKIQQNGVDLVLKDIKKIEGEAMISEENKKMPDYIDVDIYEDFFILPIGVYDVVFEEIIKLPKEVSGFIIQRSTFNRCGCRILSSWFDSGFSDRLGAIMQVTIPMKIKKGTRLAQIILFESDNNGQYNGQYQQKQIKQEITKNLHSFQIELINNLEEGLCLSDIYQKFIKSINLPNESDEVKKRIIRRLIDELVLDKKILLRIGNIGDKNPLFKIKNI